MSKRFTHVLMKPVIKAVARTRLPKQDGFIHSGELQNSVKVSRDEWGIPHIFAKSEHDLFFCQGFIHAQDRLWQMDFYRRLTAGRLSEIIGEVTLPLDKWMRTLTLRRVAEFEISLLDERTRTALNAYANGINAFLASGKLPIECFLLRYQPEAWTMADSLSWVKMMAWSLSVNWEMELLRAQVINCIGQEEAAELEPPPLSRWPFIVPPTVNYENIHFRVSDQLQQVKPFSGPSPYDGLGSNSWVVSGKWTKSGYPLLANDMHLGLTVPSIWYENHLVTDELSLYGVSFPGIPGIISGHNGHVAWGFTNGFADVQDLFIEHIRRTEAGEYEADYQGNWEKCRVIHEEIKIKDKESVKHETIITRHGPIINHLAPDLAGESPLSMCWTALDPDPMMNCLYGFFLAKDCSEFRQAARQWTTPNQNIVFADREGNIGYVLAGKIPFRNKGQGKTPVPGWTNEYEWSSYLPFSSLPSLENPSQGFIVTANNRVVGADYPVSLELEPITGDRAQRISEMILDKNARLGDEKIDSSYFKRMQFDQCSPTARVIARHLARLNLRNSSHKGGSDLEKALEYIKSWDGILNADSQAAAIYQVFIRKLIRLILKNKFHPGSEAVKKSEVNQLDLVEKVAGKGPTPILADSTLYGDRCFSWISDLCSRPDSSWFNIGKGETRDDCFLIALNQTVQELKIILGNDIENWTWGSLHKITINHALGSNELLASVFNIGPYPVGGDHTTVWATGTSYHNLDSTHMIGPAYRMIVDLAELEKSCSVLAGGQSGNPASPHFNDQTDDWLKGNYHPMLVNHEEIDSHTRHRLTFVPNR